MSSFDIAFSREYLKLTTKTVKQHFPDLKLNSAWVYHFHGDHWEFHLPIAGTEEFYWHGSASNAFEARANGWHAFLESKGIEEEDNDQI